MKPNSILLLAVLLLVSLIAGFASLTGSMSEGPNMISMSGVSSELTSHSILMLLGYENLA